MKIFDKKISLFALKNFFAKIKKNFCKNKIFREHKKTNSAIIPFFAKKVFEINAIMVHKKTKIYKQIVNNFYDKRKKKKKR